MTIPTLPPFRAISTLATIPNPEVYRRAAERVQSGEDWYSCDAIMGAVLDVIPVDSTDGLMRDREYALITDEYGSQYKQAFGPEVPHDNFSHSTGHHPFWNATKNCENPGELVQHRVTALLLMAEMVGG